MDNKNVAAYVRLSMEDRNLDGTLKRESDSIRSQREIIRMYIRGQKEISDCEITEYCDDGMTGTRFDRKDFTRMIGDMKKGRIDTIIVKDFSRFGRDYIEVGDYMEHIFPYLGIRFISINDRYDSRDYFGKTGGMEVALKNLVYSSYSRDLSVKVLSSLQTRVRSGKKVHAAARYGYQKSPDDKNRWEIDPEAAATVRLIFELAAEKHKMTEIVRILNEQGIPTPREYKRMRGIVSGARDEGIRKNWAYATVREILYDETYTGKYIWNRRGNNLSTGHKSIRKDRSEWVITENAQEAIVSEELFRRAQDCIQKITRTKNPPIKKNPLFRCAYCGRAMAFRTKSKRLLVCPQKWNTDNEDCRQISAGREECETEVMNRIRERFGDLPEIFQESRKLQNECKIFADKKKMVQHEIKRLTDEKMMMYDNFKNGGMTAEEFLARSKEIQERLQKKKEEKEQLQIKIEQAEEQSEKKKMVADVLAGDCKFDREKVLQYVECVKVYRDRPLEIVWRE